MSGTICTGNGVTVFQLLAVKGALRLESIGLKHSSGRSLRKFWALQMGLKANAKVEQVLEAIEKKLAEVRAQLKPGEIEAF